uniref:Uncharacterized protein n=1 Tax=Cacopsylla melanoneura TaxID=428564 RepID=A0A8D9BP23_9HEMI
MNVLYTYLRLLGGATISVVYNYVKESIIQHQIIESKSSSGIIIFIGIIRKSPLCYVIATHLGHRVVSSIFRILYLQKNTLPCGLALSFLVLSIIQKFVIK